MVTKKKNNAIALGLISAIALIIAYFLGSPLANTMHQDRPIVYVSFGNGKDLPKSQLQSDGQNYYVDIVLTNKGKTDGKITLDAVGTDATVSFHKNGPFQTNSIYNVIMFANSTSAGFVKVFVLPTGADRFSINLMVQPQIERSPFQDLTALTPLVLTYQKSGDDYALVDAR